MKCNAFAVVIARKGSQRLPGKNSLALGGKPLFAWTLDAALESGSFSQVWVSTDDPEIISYSENVEGVRVDHRPPELSGPHSRGGDVLLHMINIARKQDPGVDTFCMLQPTSPFRTGTHINAALSLLEEENTDYALGVQKYSTPPHFALEYHQGLTPVHEGYLTEVCDSKATPQQCHPAGGVYVGRIDPFLAQGHWYGPRARGLFLDTVAAWDINDATEFYIAEAIARQLLKETNEAQGE